MAMLTLARTGSPMRSTQTEDAVQVTSVPRQSWVGWLPLVCLPIIACSLGKMLPPWGFMWTLAFSIYISLKWWTWWRVRSQIPHPAWRSLAYLLAWPGMDAESFLGASQSVQRPTWRSWLRAFFNTTLGAAFLWGVARAVPDDLPLLRGWIGMLGLILVLHFGSFEIVSLGWRRIGVDARPIMSAPLSSTSLTEFWGGRWNLGFRQLAHELIFLPAQKSLGVGLAGFLVFVASGLIHDLVISVPARAGYGLPSGYFVLQGIGVAVERSSFGRQLGLRRGLRGWIFMAMFTAGPAFWLFHPAFVRTVMLPFMQAIRAL